MPDNTNHDTADTHTMTDHNPEPTTASNDTYNTKTTRRIGNPDPTAIDTARTTTDVGNMDKREEVVIHPCKCGNTEATLDAVTQCTDCGDRCCPECRITLSRRIRCPDCTEEEFHLNKAVFIALYLLDNATDDLFHQHIEDQAATTLLEHSYVQVEAADHNGQIQITPDDPLTVAGKEALHVGEQLYGDDEDVAEIIEDNVIQQVANNGP